MLDTSLFLIGGKPPRRQPARQVALGASRLQRVHPPTTTLRCHVGKTYPDPHQLHRPKSTKQWNAVAPPE